MNGRPSDNFSSIRVQPASDEIQQRTFTSPIRPNESQPGPSINDITKIPNDRLASKTFAHPPDFHNLLAGSPGSHIDVQGIIWFGPVLGLQRFDPLDASFLFASPSHGAATQPGQLALQSIAPIQLIFFL